MSAKQISASFTSGLIDLEKDLLKPVRKLAKQLADWDMPPSTQWRVIRKGVRGCRLEAKLVKGVWHSTAKAWAAFIEAQTTAALGSDAPTAAPAERSAAKTAKLQAAGLI